MNATSEDIKDLLVDESSLDLVFAENLFIGRLPESPDSCVVIYDTSSVEPAQTFERSYEYNYESIQIRARGINYTTVWAQIQDIGTFLQGLNNFTLNDTFYALIKIKSGPFQLEWDDNNRINLVINFEIQRR